MKIPEQDPRGLIAGGVVIVVLAGVATLVYVVVAQWVILPLIAVMLAFGVWFIAAGVLRRRARSRAASVSPPGPTAAGTMVVPLPEPLLATGTPTGWYFVASANQSVIKACYDQFSLLITPPSGSTALLQADAATLARRAADPGVPGRTFGASRRVGQGDLTRVDTAEMLKGLAREAVGGEVHLALAASDSPILASSIYGEIYREAVAQGILPFPMYSVQDRFVADFVTASCRPVEETSTQPPGAAEAPRPEPAQPEPAHAAVVGAGVSPADVGPGAPPSLDVADRPIRLQATGRITVTGGADAARALVEASYDPVDADAVIIGLAAGAEAPASVLADGWLTCPGCRREIPFHAVVSPGFMGDGGTAVCDVCHSRVALSYYPRGGDDNWGALLVAHTLVSPSQRLSVEILSLSASPQ